MHLVQIHDGAIRHVALVDEPHLRLLDDTTSVHQLALEAAAAGQPLTGLVRARTSRHSLEYDAVYAGRSPWRLLPAIDHPDEPARCLISGTGLTHLGSAADRQRMHEIAGAEPTDSMKMFRLGVASGKPAPNAVGAAPEWFFKGTGSVLRAHGDPLDVPAFAEDGGEEAEIAGVYVIDAAGVPRRVGMALGNEFSDHVFEKRNYLNLAGSKLRTCALGPELVIDPVFDRVPGRVAIGRGGREVWSKPITSGEGEMCHSLRNIEHHHFKYDQHRRPGDVHVHYFGACALSYGDGVKLADGDVMEVAFEGYGRPLRNPVHLDRRASGPVVVAPLG